MACKVKQRQHTHTHISTRRGARAGATFKFLIGAILPIAISLVSSLIAPRPKKSQQESVPPSSSYGQSIPRVFGHAVVGTNILWARKPIGRGRKGKQQRKNAAKGDTKLTFQVLVGEGERFYNNLDPAYSTVTSNASLTRTVSTHCGPTSTTQYSQATTLTPISTSGLESIDTGANVNIYQLENQRKPRITPSPITGFVGTDILFGFSNSSTNITSTTSQDFLGWFGCAPNEVPIKIVPAIANQSGTIVVTGGGAYGPDILQALQFFPAFKQGGRIWIGEYVNTNINIQAPIISDFYVAPNFLSNSRAYPQASVTGQYLVNGVSVDHISPAVASASINFDQPFEIGWSLGFSDNTASVGIAWTGVQSFRLAYPASGPAVPTTIFRDPLAVTTTINSGKLKLERIWLQDKLWYDVTARASTAAYNESIIRQQYFTFYDGSLTQLQDPTMVSFLGANRVSAYRGYSYIVFKGLPGMDFNGNFPTVKVQVNAYDLAPNAQTVTTDILLRAGVQSNRMLQMGRDWFPAQNLSTAAYNANPDGYLLQSDDLRQELLNALQIFRLGLVSGDAIDAAVVTGTGAPLNVIPRPNLRLASLDAYQPEVETVAYGSLGAETKEHTIPEVMTNVQEDIANYPSSLEFSFYQPRLDSQRETVRADRVSAGTGETRQLSVEFVWSDRSAPSKIAVWLLRRGWRVAQQHTLKTIMPMMPLWDFNSLNLSHNEGADRFYTLVADKVIVGADGRSEVSASSVRAAIPDMVFTPNETDLTNDMPDTVNDAKILWFDGPNVPTTNARSVGVLLAPTSPTASEITDTVTLAYSTDAGASYTSLSTDAYVANSLLLVGAFSGFPGSHDAVYGVIDYATKIVITVPAGVQLTSTTDGQLFDRTTNLMYVPGMGMAAYKTATLTGPNVYTLTGILWDVAGSAFDYQRTLTNGNNNVWILTSSPVAPQIPAGVPEGATLRLGVVGSAGVINSFERVYAQDSLAPRPINDKYVELRENGNMIASWGLGQTQLVALSADIFNDEPTDTLATGLFTVLIYKESVPSTVVRTISGLTSQSYTYTLADRTTDGLTTVETRFVVIREGYVSSNTPTVPSVTWFGLGRNWL